MAVPRLSWAALAASCAVAVGWLLLFGAVAVPLTGPAAAATAGHRPKPSATAALPGAPANAGVSISVTDGRTSAAAGDRLVYSVQLLNGGAKKSPAYAVTLTLPGYLRFVSASGHGKDTAGRIGWHAAVRAGHSVSERVVTVLRRPPPGMSRLAVVACASLAGRQVVCAAHLDQLAGTTGTAGLPGGAPGRPGHGAAVIEQPAVIAALVVVTAVAVLATWLARRRRGLRGHA